MLRKFFLSGLVVLVGLAALSLAIPTAQQIQLLDVCTVCRCLDDSEESTLVVECNGEMWRNHQQQPQQYFDLRGIVWPVAKGAGDPLKVRAYFRDLDLQFLPKIATSLNVVELHFNNDSISALLTEPFGNFKNLEILSLSNNNLEVIDKDFFAAANNLTKLDLSSNALTALTALERARFDRLESVDLSHNNLKAVSIQLVKALQHASVVRMAACQIYNWDSSNGARWEVLDLSWNKLAVISASTFATLDQLKALYLSHNDIQMIDPQAFAGLSRLERLDLSYNRISNLGANLILPESLSMVSIAGNGIQRWPFKELPSGLRILHVQDNELFDLSIGTGSSVLILNVSNNRLETFDGGLFPELIELDLSYNALPEIPRYLGKTLQTLILDGNPMEKVFFETELPLQLLSLNRMPLLSELSAFSFWKLVGAESSNEMDCVEIRISNCPKLEHIAPKAFEDTTICKLDLSNNQLTKIPKDMLEWKELYGGINLQGNPLDCDCSEEWLLDTILPLLYDNEDLQYLLDDLRCASPTARDGKRLIKYLNHRGAFCGGSEDFKGPRMERLQMADLRGGSHVMAVDNDVVQAGFFSKIICAVDDPDCLHAHEGFGMTIVISLVAVTMVTSIAMVAFLIVRRSRERRAERERTAESVWLVQRNKISTFL